MAAAPAVPARPKVPKGCKRVVLVRSSRERLGFGFEGNVVARVSAGGAGERAGIAVGDVLLKVDGVDVEDRGQAGLFELLSAAGRRTEIVLRKARVARSSIASLVSGGGGRAAASERTVTLDGQGGKLGLSLSDDARTDSAGNTTETICISGVRPGTVAAESGAVAVGDVLLRVDGQCVGGQTGLTYGEVIARLSSGAPVELVLA